MRVMLVLTLALASPAIAQERPPAKPYAPLAAPMRYAPADPGLDALRVKLRDIVARKDLAALRPHVLAKGFFWDNDWYRVFEPKKSGFDNLKLAYNFGTGFDGDWAEFGRALTETVATLHPKRPGVVCLPARPTASDAEIKKFAQSLGVDTLEIVYARTESLPVYDKPEAGARVVDTLGAHFVRKYDWATHKGEPWTVEGSWIEIVTPAGKRAFAAPGTLDAGLHIQTCFAKDATGAWKIAGTVHH
jgi:hypothetical protein